MENDINTLKLIEMASAHLKVQGIQSGIVPMPGTDKSIIIGSPAEVVELMPELRGAIPAAWHNFARAIADLPHGAEANIAGMQSKAAQLLAAEGARGKVLPKDEGAVPDTFAVNFIEQRAAQYLQDHADTEPGTGAVAFEFGETGREYHSTLVELADDIRSALKQSDDAQPDACDVPPTGWSCTRVAGHAGPCAAQPVAASAGIEGLDKWNASRKHLGAMQMCDGGNYLKRVDVERLLATQSAKQGAQPSAVPIELVGVREEIKEGSGFWSPCSGCHDTEDGHPTGPYSYSHVFGCALGSGCSECGGIGAVWDNADYEAMASDWHKDQAAAPAAPLQTMDDTTRNEAWRPILTVPMDGSEVLLYLGAPYSSVVKARWFDVGENWIEGEFPDVDDEYCGIGSRVPTHWMPLPEAPTAIRALMKSSSPVSDEVQTAAAHDVLAERRRQVEVEGWHPDQDDDYEDGQLSTAAACYAMQGNSPDYGPPDDWPWERDWWKPTDDRRNLVKAGALILADIERIDRALMKPSSPVSGEGEKA